MALMTVRAVSTSATAMLRPSPPLSDAWPESTASRVHDALEPQLFSPLPGCLRYPPARHRLHSSLARWAARHATAPPLRQTGRSPTSGGLSMAGDFIARHLRACDGFSMVVDGAGDRWSSPSPCSGWDAGAVVEHVIGFHDVLLLRPLGSKHHLPKGEPTVRWAATVTRVGSAVLDAPEDVILPGPGGSEMALPLLLPMLTTEVLLHTWDLAKAVGQPVSLDVELCAARLRGRKAERGSSAFVGDVRTTRPRV